MRPTALMLALSAAVLALDPSVPLPRSACPNAAELREDSEHWSAVASYAEAFPAALARRVGPARAAGDERPPLDFDAFAARVSGAAKAIQSELA